MKTSSGLLLGVLFTLVVVIVAVVIYFNTRPGEEKPETSTGPSSTLPGISDLTVSRTDSPDSGSESYTIEPYTIEYLTPEEEAAAYVEGDNEKALSKNITFTLNWTNNDGFDNVTGIKIEHYIDTAANGSLEIKRTMDDESITLRSNFTDVSYSITGDGEYSFVGKNRFKIIAVLDRKVSDEPDANYQEHTLYDGLEDESGNILSINQLDIKSEDLTATIGMALPLTKTFELELQDGSNTGENKATKKITNKKYTFKAVPYKNNPPSKEVDESKKVEYTNIELISQDAAGQKFKFRSGDTYWAIGAGGGGNSKDTSVAAADKVYGYYTLKTDETDPNKAAIIIFAKSSKPRDPGMERDYNSLKIVMGTAEAPIDMYLYGIDGNVTFRPLDDTLVSTSYKLSNTRHWKIT